MPIATYDNLIAWLGRRSHRVQAPHHQQVHLSRTSASDHPRELPVFHTPQSGRQNHVPTRTRRSLRHEGTYATHRTTEPQPTKNTRMEIDERSGVVDNLLWEEGYPDGHLQLLHLQIRGVA